MSESDTFAVDLEKAFSKMSENWSLEEAQHAYRQLIYSAGLKILERFPEAAVGEGGSSGYGPEEPELVAGTIGIIFAATGGGSTGGGRPGFVLPVVLNLAWIVLGLRRPKKKRGR
jgi:hypothetical protein